MFNKINFDPNGPPVQAVGLGNNSVVSMILESSDGKEKVLGIVNVSNEVQEVSLARTGVNEVVLYDIIPQEHYNVKNGKLALTPYQVTWLKLAVSQPGLVDFEEFAEDENQKAIILDKISNYEYVVMTSEELGLADFDFNQLMNKDGYGIKGIPNLRFVPFSKTLKYPEMRESKIGV